MNNTQLRKHLVLFLIILLVPLFQACEEVPAEEVPAEEEVTKNDALKYAFGYCDGSLGSFDVYVMQNPDDLQLFDVSIVPVTLDTESEVVSIYITNEDLEYRKMIEQVVLSFDTEINAGTLTQEENEKFDILVIMPYQEGVSFDDVIAHDVAQKDVICTLPLIGYGQE